MDEQQDRLVIGVASSALFDLRKPEAVFVEEGPEAYHRYQDEHLDDPLPPGVAMPFISRLLRLNSLAPDRVDDPLVDVIVMSRNSAVTGLRVMRSLQHYEVPVIRAVFTEGMSPFAYCPAFGVSLFLSWDQASVRAAIQAGVPAGQVLASEHIDDEADQGIRIVPASGRSAASRAASAVPRLRPTTTTRRASTSGRAAIASWMAIASACSAFSDGLPSLAPYPR